jgi:hypothetical protein
VLISVDLGGAVRHRQQASGLDPSFTAMLFQAGEANVLEAWARALELIFVDSVPKFHIMHVRSRRAVSLLIVNHPGPLP